jgi:hypothetical protein
VIVLGGIRLILIVGDVYSGVLANVTVEAGAPRNARRCPPVGQTSEKRES